jgi:hypothetical protein
LVDNIATRGIGVAFNLERQFGIACYDAGNAASLSRAADFNVYWPLSNRTSGMFTPDHDRCLLSATFLPLLFAVCLLARAAAQQDAMAVEPMDQIPVFQAGQRLRK